MLQQQLIGILNLSFPIIILYNIMPAFVMTLPGQIVCSLAIGAYVYYCAFMQLRNLERTLQYGPTGQYKDSFIHLIQECGIDPENIVLKYAYTNESLALTAGSTIIIDPWAFNDVAHDPQAVAVEEILRIHIQPTLTDSAKLRIAAMKDVMTPGAQRFIFKHEIAHVVHNFSIKKMILLFVTSFCAVLFGIQVAMLILPINGLLAAIVGTFVGGCADLFLTLLSNVVWKLQAEKAADAFAVQYSSDEDIRAAARFFENHQAILDQHLDTTNILSQLPSVIKSGHQYGTVRSAYLLQLMANKN